MRKAVPPRGLRQAYMHPQGLRPSGRIAPGHMNRHMAAMARRPDPVRTLRRHSELKQPYRFRDYRLMEGSLEPWPEVLMPRESSGLPLTGELDYPTDPGSWDGIGPWVIDPGPTAGIVGPGGVGGTRPASEDDAWGQPAVPVNSGFAFLAWTVYAGGGVWGYVANLVIYGHNFQYSFGSASDLFSRISLFPAPGWYAAGTADLDYFNITEYDNSDQRGGAMAADGPLPSGELWGASRPIPDGTLRLRSYWGIDYPPGTADHRELISLETIRVGAVGLAVDGREVPVKGQSVLYREYVGGGIYHYYWELNGYGSRLLLGDEQTGGGWPNQVCADGYARLDVTGKYGLWPGGEHGD
ncbi:MAG: hypothetical protein JRI22_13970 [Deltaproteobacteria bacterium]|nr:hypothetical protein [Deltaproteobacteria bacterium]